MLQLAPTVQSGSGFAGVARGPSGKAPPIWVHDAKVLAGNGHQRGIPADGLWTSSPYRRLQLQTWRPLRAVPPSPLSPGLYLLRTQTLRPRGSSADR